MCPRGELIPVSKNTESTKYGHGIWNSCGKSQGTWQHANGLPLIFFPREPHELPVFSRTGCVCAKKTSCHKFLTLKKLKTSILFLLSVWSLWHRHTEKSPVLILKSWQHPHPSQYQTRKSNIEAMIRTHNYKLAFLDTGFCRFYYSKRFG